MSKLTHLSSLLCQLSVTDKNSNTMSLINVAEDLTIGLKKDNHNELEEVVAPLNMELVSFWAVDKKIDKIDLKISLLNSNQETIIENEKALAIKDSKPRLRTAIRIGGIKMPCKSDDYSFVVRLKKSNKFIEVAKIPIKINFKFI